MGWDGMCQVCEVITHEPLWKALQRKDFVLPITSAVARVREKGVDVYEMSAGAAPGKARRGTIVKELQFTYICPISFEGKRGSSHIINVSMVP